MKLLLDESLSSRLSDPLSEVGHDVIHVGDLDLLSEPDDVILAAARQRDRAVLDGDRLRIRVLPILRRGDSNGYVTTASGFE